MNIAVLVPVPADVITLIVPVDAVIGTVAVICESLLTAKVALVVPIVTFDAPVKLVPVITTLLLGNPIVGAKLDIPGITLNELVLVAVPAALVALILPVTAPDGTFTLIIVADTGVIAPAFTVPLAAVNSTSVTEFKFVPVIVIVAPIAPLVGVNEVMVGFLITVNIAVLVPLPAGVVTLIVAVDAVAGTVAVI
jgi:hypothetical protein